MDDREAFRTSHVRARRVVRAMLAIGVALGLGASFARAADPAHTVPVDEPPFVRTEQRARCDHFDPLRRPYFRCACRQQQRERRYQEGAHQPISQLVPSLTTGTLLAPPPATVLRKVVAVASVTNARAPAPAVAAAARLATVMLGVCI